MFVLQSQLIDQKCLEIFEALDQDISDASDYFIEKCSEINKERLVMLRDKRLGNEGRTLLHNAARNGSLSAALSLLRAGHPVEPFDSSVSRITPLMEAIQYKHIEIAVILLEAGASLTTPDVNGENALHYVARGGSFGLLKNLITAANLPARALIDCASSRTIRGRFPEDMAKSRRMLLILRHLRTTGQYVNISSRMFNGESL